MSYVWCVEISENVSKVGSCIGAVWQYFPHFHNFIDVHSLVTIIKIVHPCCFLAPIVYTTPTPPTFALLRKNYGLPLNIFAWESY